MIRPTSGAACTIAGGRHMLRDDAQVLAACPNHPQHVGMKPFLKAAVRDRDCMHDNF